MKQDLLFQKNGDPRSNPITHDRQEVLKDGKKMITPRNRADEFNDHDEDAPHPSGYRLRIMTQCLERDCRRVRKRCVVCNRAESNDHGAKSAEGSEAPIRFKQKGTSGDPIGVGPAGNIGYSGRNTDAKDVAEQ